MKNVNSLRFPSGRTAGKVKQEAKQIKKASNGALTHTQALNAVSRLHGLAMDWDDAMDYLEKFWNGWFAVDIYQEDAPWQIDVRTGGFDTKEEALAFAQPFSGSLKWVGGAQPLIHVNDNTGEHRVLFNSDVRLWRLKPESEGKMMISMDDMERVYAPISEWAKLFGNERPTFDSQAWGVEHGDDPGNTPVVDEKPMDKSTLDAHMYLEKMGLKLRSQQAGGKVFQIKHGHCKPKPFSYVLVDGSREQMEDLIAALFIIQEEENLMPNYYGGAMSIDPRFVTGVLRECFDVTIISCDHFDASALSDEEIADNDIDVIEVFGIEDGFDRNLYEWQKWHDLLTGKHFHQLTPIYRKALGMPAELDEASWKLININPNAVTRAEFPLEMSNLSVGKAWTKRFSLEDKIFNRLEAELDDHAKEFRFQIYREMDTDYPVYRVRHPDFEFDAT